MAAFTSGLLAADRHPDGVRDIEEHEHADGFWSFAGAPLARRPTTACAPRTRSPFGPTAVGRKGRGAMADAEVDDGRARRRRSTKPWRPRWRGRTSTSDKYVRAGPVDATTRSERRPPGRRPPGRPTPAQSRTVAKPAPRLFRPAPPIVAVARRQAQRPASRRRAVRPEGLRCRWPGECQPGFQGVVDPAQILPTLGSGADPDEVLAGRARGRHPRPLLRSAGSRAPASPKRSGRLGRHASPPSTSALYGASMTYDGSGADRAPRGRLTGPRAAASSWSDVSASSVDSATQLSVELAGYSYVAGATPSPVALNPWRQPWVPLYVEWKVRVRGARDARRMEPRRARPRRSGRPTGPARHGRSDVHGTQPDLHRDRQVARDGDDGVARPPRTHATRRHRASPSSARPTRSSFARLRDLLAPLDLVSSSLDGIREQLLGIDYLAGAMVRADTRRRPDGAARPVASGLPTPLFGGTLEVLELRAVDAFGRVLDDPGRLDADDQPRSRSPDAPATIAPAPRGSNTGRGGCSGSSTPATR